MPYVVLEDVGTTPRRSLSERRRLQAWERTGGICVVCGVRIDGVRDRWIVEHIRALELGGADALENMGPAHEACGREKTRDDHARTARAKRQKVQHLGAAVTNRPMPGSRACALKRKINGTVVPREGSTGGGINRRLAQERHIDQTDGPGSLSTKVWTEPIGPLCADQPRSAKKGDAGTGAPMANPPPPPRRRERVGTRHDAPPSGDIRPAIPAHLDFLFDDRPLLPGESAEQYDALRDSIVKQVKPTDVIEAIWVKDIIDLIWEAKRLRRWRGQILVQARLVAAADLIRPAFQLANPMQIDGITGPSVDTLAAGWSSGKKGSQDQVDKYLQERDLTAEDVTAHAFLLNLPSIERVDRLASLVDQRRDALLREIDRKRTSLALRLRNVAADVFDVEPTETP